MKYSLLLRLVGLLLSGEALLMLPSLGVALIYNEGDAISFGITITLLLLVGMMLIVFNKPSTQELSVREAFSLVGVSWLLFSFFGALPFVFSGHIPNLVDAFFETVSGFTTTGASILKNVELLPHGLIFWRSFTHWVGGMGVLMLTVALIPKLGGRTHNIMRAESPGPSPGKMLPKMQQFALALYIIYFLMTLLLTVLLVICGMSLFDALTHAFGTAGTGGFGIKNASVGYYNSVEIEFVIGLFMLLFGVNFSVYFAIYLRNFKQAFKNTELYTYFGVVFAAIAVITISILPQYPSFGNALRYAAFTVSSIVTTTGFVTADFQQWPLVAHCVILFLMLMGACAGSTGGGIKVVRMVLLGKTVRHDIRRMLHPRSVNNIKLDGNIVEDEVARGVMVFFFSYIAVIVVSTLFISLDNFDLETSISSVISAVSNIGPGLGLAGPTGNYAAFSPLSKLVLSTCMLIGRLEVMPIFMLFTRSLWRKA